jgi:hypothetical protein
MRTYSLTAENITVAGATTLAYLHAPTSGIKEIEILRVEVGFTGDNTSRQHAIDLAQYASAYPTLTSKGPVALDISNPASSIVGGTAGAAGTSGINATAEGAGAKTVLYRGAMNSLTGYVWVPTPDDRIVIPRNSGFGFGVRLAASPATLSGWHCTIVFGER